MASTATEVGRLELMADGENDNLWGEKTNENIKSLSRMTGGYIVVPLSGSSVTLTDTDFATGDHHNFYFKLTGTLTVACDLILPAITKSFVVENATTGAFTVEVATLAGTGVVVPQGAKAFLQCDGTNVIGTVLQAYSANLAAIGGAATVGIPSRKSDGTWNQRTIEGTADQITVTNGDGGDGNPKLSLSSALVLPGTVSSAGGFTVQTGGLTIQGGGLNVQQGNARVTGANATFTLASSSGFGGFEVSGPSGAIFDLKNSESEDFDLRAFTNGTGGGITSAGALNLTSSASESVILNVGTGIVAAATGAGFGVYTGLIDLVVNGNNDSKIQFRNSVATWDVGVRGGGGWSVRNGGQDVITGNPDNSVNILGTTTVTAGGFAVLNGSMSLAGGDVNFTNASGFQSKGIFDDAQTKVIYVRNSLNVGINAAIPQQMLHLGSLGTTKNAVIRVETGNGTSQFRGWDFGTNFGDFSFFISDTTAGLQRFSIATNGLTTISAPLTVSGSLTATNTASIARTGAGTTLTIGNPLNTGNDGCQVQYNGQRFNVFTRVVQGNGNFDFVNTNYSQVMMSITQAGACLNTTGTYGTLSDLRLKENVDDARDRTEDLMKLRVIEYSLKSDALDHADKVGFSAQQVRQVMPEMTLEAGDFDGVDNALAVATSNMTPLIIQALQSLNRRLGAIENAQ